MSQGKGDGDCVCVFYCVRPSTPICLKAEGFRNSLAFTPKDGNTSDRKGSWPHTDSKRIFVACVCLLPMEDIGNYTAVLI